MDPAIETAARALARERVLFNIRRDDARKDPVDIEAAVNYAWRDYVEPATAVINALRKADFLMIPTENDWKRAAPSLSRGR